MVEETGNRLVWIAHATSPARPHSSQHQIFHPHTHSHTHTTIHCTHIHTHTHMHTARRGGNGWQRVTNIGQNVYCCVARCCVWFDCCLPCHRFVRRKTSSLYAIPFQYAMCNPRRYITMFGELRKRDGSKPT